MLKSLCTNICLTLLTYIWAEFTFVLTIIANISIVTWGEDVFVDVNAKSSIGTKLKTWYALHAIVGLIRFGVGNLKERLRLTSGCFLH